MEPDRPLGALELPFGRVGGRWKSDGWIEAVSRSAQSPELLNDSHGPAGDVVGQFFSQCEGSLAAPVVDGLADVDPAAALVEARDQVCRQQVTDVVDNPVVARLD